MPFIFQVKVRNWRQIRHNIPITKQWYRIIAKFIAFSLDSPKNPNFTISPKRLSKKSCGHLDMFNHVPMEVGSIIWPMGSDFRASNRRSTPWVQLVECFQNSIGLVLQVLEVPPMPFSAMADFGALRGASGVMWLPDGLAYEKKSIKMKSLEIFK